MLKDKCYFRLSPECLVVMGARRSVIHDLLSGEAIECDEEESFAIMTAENNSPVNCLENHQIEVLKKIQAMGWGTFHEKPIYIEKVHDNSPLKESISWLKPPDLVNAYIEITHQCDLDCRHCNDGALQRCECLTCKRGNRDVCIVKDDFLCAIVKTLCEMECARIILRGGNPFCAQEQIKKAVDAARNYDTSIAIISNFVDIDEPRMELIIKNNIEMIVPVFEPTASEYDARVSRPGAYLKVMENMRRFKANGGSLLRKHSEPYTNQTGAPEYLPNREKMQIFPMQFKQVNSTCLYGSLAIRSNGLVVPCPGLDSFVVGDLASENLSAIIGEKRLDKFWHATKEKVTQCNSCEFRYCCEDCRALESKLTSELYGMGSCSYNLG